LSFKIEDACARSSVFSIISTFFKSQEAVVDLRLDFKEFKIIHSHQNFSPNLWEYDKNVAIS